MEELNKIIKYVKALDFYYTLYDQFGEIDYTFLKRHKLTMEIINNNTLIIRDKLKRRWCYGNIIIGKAISKLLVGGGILCTYKQIPRVKRVIREWLNAHNFNDVKLKYEFVNECNLKLKKIIYRGKNEEAREISY